MVAWLGFRQVAFPYNRQARFAGTTKYPLWKMIRFATDAVTSFSIVPLHISSVFGIGLGLLALLGAIYTVISWVAFDTVPGWASVMLGMSLFGSIQLISLGIIGEYLGRIYMENKRRPIYVLSEVAGRRRGPRSAAPGSAAEKQEKAEAC
jgi:dolichol-phosphate mannosyltransferase